MADQTATETRRDGVPQQEQQPTPSVSDPAELIRLVGMLQALTTEARDTNLDEAGHAHLLDVHRRAVEAVKELVSDDLESELTELGLPLGEDATGPELRLAQGQLVGWLNGLFQGIQTAIAAQQMSSGQQLQQLQEPSQPTEEPRGQYL